MDVLRPPLLYLGDCCYRVNPGDRVNSTASHTQFTPSHTQAELEGDSDLLQDNDLDEADERITENKKGGFMAQLDIPSALYKFVIGSKGDTKRRLEYETRCSIEIPRIGQPGYIVVRGASARHVSSAITRIESLAESSKRKLPFTHFVSIPFNHNQLQDSFSLFKEAVEEKCALVEGLDMSLFQTPAKLHLTVCTLKLLSDKDVDRATQVFHSCRDQVRRLLGSEDFKLVLEGLDYMNDDPSAVDVLYAKVKSSSSSHSGDSLQDAIDYIEKQFNKAGLSENEYSRDRVKLHITLLNTTFRQPKPSTKERGRRPPRDVFNAQSILKEFSDYKFGEIEFPGLHLSQRYSTNCQGYYNSLTSMLVPATDSTKQSETHS